MDYTRLNYIAACEMLDEQKWQYIKDDNEFTIDAQAAGTNLPIVLRFQFNPRLEIATLYSPLKDEAKKAKREIMAVAATYANVGLIDGNFDYDYASGKVVFRLTASYKNCVLSKDTYQYMLFLTCKLVNDYNAKFKRVCDEKLSEDDVRKLFE